MHLKFAVPNVLLIASFACTVACAEQASTQQHAKAVEVYNLGVSLYQNHQPAEAAKKFKEAARLDPAFTEAHYNCGTALIYSNDYSEAIKEFDEALKLKPQKWKAYTQKAVCQERLGDLRGAVETYKAYLKINPGGADASEIKQRMAAYEREIAASPVRVSPNAPDYLEEICQHGMVRWNADRMPLKVYIKDGSNVPNYKSSYPDLIKQSFSAWAEASHGKLSFAYVTDPTLADIDVIWTNDPNDLSTPAEGGHAQITLDRTKLIRAHIAMLTTAANGRVFDEQALRRTALHEIGHALGISGHSTGPKDVMFAVADPMNINCDLSARDCKTMVELYSKDDAFAEQHRITNVREPGGDPDSPVVKAVKLNSEAAEAMRNKNYALAKTKLEESLRLRPDGAAATSNLGSVYRWESFQARNAGNNAEAAKLLSKAINLYQSAKNLEGLKRAQADYAEVMAELRR